MLLKYAIIFVSDMQRSVAFYKDVIGLSLKFESPDWTEFATEGATLALHVTDAPITSNDSQKKSPAGQCYPGLSVKNIDDFHKRMVENNVTCVLEPVDEHGHKLAGYLDPDGLAISVSEELKS